MLALGLLMFTRGPNLFSVSFPDPHAVAGVTVPEGAAVADVAGGYTPALTDRVDAQSGSGAYLSEGDNP